MSQPSQPIAVRDNHALVSFAAKELEPQGKRAISGMVEVLKFYALVSVLKTEAEAHEALKSHDEIKIGRGRPSKESDLKAIFAKYAPGLNLKSAHRLYDVGCGIAGEYKEIVGGKVAKEFTLPELVIAEPKNLPESVQKKQQALFDYVSGTSRNSWLDKIRPSKERGGDTTNPGKPKKKTAAEAEAELEETLQNDCKATGKSVEALGVKYRILTDAEAEGLRDILRAKADELDAWIKTPKKSRPVLDKVKAIAGEKH